MMVTERPVASPPPEPTTTPPSESPGAAPPTLPPIPSAPPGPVTLQPSPFLNGFDLVLVVGVIVLGFAIASFSVRNADFWRHAGTGRLIAEGNYVFGNDPLSYTTKGRKWTNPSWLYDVIVYKLYSASPDKGRPVVVFKAILIALMASVLLFARRKGQSMWLGAMCVGLVLLAAAPRMVMAPAIMSMLFLAVTIWLLIHASRFKDRWSLPVAFAALFAVWSNCDEWFILGPIALGLFALGEFLQQRTRPEESADQRVPLRSLGIAFGAGLLACMLNPHHIGVWRLPTELQNSVGEIMARDPLFAPVFRSAFEKGGLDLDESQGGNRVNAYAFVLLVLLNAAALLLGRKRLSWGMLLVNSAFLGLAIVRQRAIPFYAIVAAPITAMYFGFVVRQLHERTFSRGTLQSLAGARVAIRMFLLMAGLGALAATWPGWLHPFTQHRRMAWDVVPDPCLLKAAKVMQQWRVDGRVPAKSRSLIVHPDLADYCAFYAPLEKNYFDSRIALHASEADALFKLREHLKLQRSGTAKLPEFDMDKFLGENDIAFVAMTGRDRRDGIDAFTRLTTDRYTDVNPYQLKWDLWDIAGRTSFFGWARQTTMSNAQAVAMRFNAVEKTFGADAEKVPDAEQLTPPPSGQRTFLARLESRYLDVPPEPAAPGTEETFLLNQHQQILMERVRNRVVAITNLFGWIGNRTMVGAISFAANELIEIAVVRPANPQSVALLAVRAARSGIQKSPHNPFGYFALAEAYKSPFLTGVPDDVKEIVMIASLGRYYLRLEPEQQASPTEEQSQQAAQQLFQMHDAQGRIDLAAEYLRRSLTGIRMGPRPLRSTDSEFLWALLGMPRPPLGDAELEETLKRAEEVLKKFEQEARTRENTWLNNTAKLQSQFQRAKLAQQFGLYRKSLQELTTIDTGDGSKLPRDQIYGVLFERIRLNLLVGQAEESDEIVRMIDDGLQKQRQNDQMTDFDHRDFRQVRIIYSKLVLDTLLVLGRFTDAIKNLNAEGAEIKNTLESLRKQPLLQLDINKRRTTLGFTEVVQLWITQRLIPRTGISFLEMLYTPEYEMMVPQYSALFRRLEDLHFQIGMICLEQGDNTAAVTHFREVRRSATKRMQTQRQAVARRLLDVLGAK